MPDRPLSPKLLAKIGNLFPPREIEQAISMLKAENDPSPDERVFCACLKLSQGSLERLAQAIKDSKIDWRDVLVWAGFENDPKDHLVWLNS